MGGRIPRETRISADWLQQPGTQALFRHFEAAGAQLYAVGGCVRNALLGVPVTDVDMASDAEPETARRFLEAAGFRVIPTGLAHGTLTVISEGQPYEITTFRRDVETDGRHAVVAFAKNMAEDAARRDFTVNALYADAGGRVSDPVGGLPDLEARRIRFIGDPAARIREDYLRILRFFRFHAQISGALADFDAEALHAIGTSLDGLDALSRERVGAEMRKLLQAADPAPALATMQATGVLARLLPGADTAAVPVLVHAEAALGLAPDPIRRLTALGAQDAGDRLRLSRAETRQLSTLRDRVGTPAGPAELGYRLGVQEALSVLALRSALLGAPASLACTRDVERGASAVCPVTARDLQPAYSGAELGARLREIEAAWIASDFTADRDSLLA